MARGSKSKGVKRPRVDEKFWSQDARVKYEKYFDNRAVKCEGNVELNDFAHLYVKENFEERQWSKICEGHEYAVRDLVCEFYANLHDVKRDEQKAACYLRGKEFDFTPDTIAKFYNLPRVPTANFPYPKDAEPTLQDMAMELFAKPGDVDKILHNDLYLKGRILHKIVASLIIPCGHTTHPSKETLLMVYALSRREEIDLASHMWDVICRVAHKPSGTEGLPFGSFITRLAKKKAIRIGDGEARQERNPTIYQLTEKLSNVQVHGRVCTTKAKHGKAKNGTNLAPQLTIKELAQDIHLMYGSLRMELADIRNEFRAEIAALRHDLDLAPCKRLQDDSAVGQSSDGADPLTN